MRSEALKGGRRSVAAPTRATLQPVKDDRFSLEDSRFVRTTWVWRSFLMLSMVGIGIAIIFAGNGKSLLAVLWVVISLGWFAFAMGLWRKHTKLDG